MNSNNRFTIFPSSTNSVSVFPGFQQVWAKSVDLGIPKGNKRKNFRDRVKWRQEFEKPLDPLSPSGLLWYMDSRA
jgi:hypothetical protein